MNHQEQEIGIATMVYDTNGKIMNTSFVPLLQIKHSKKLESQLQTVKGSEDAEALNNNAQLVMAAWFSQVDEIELADRDEYEVVSKVLSCEKYQSGRVKTCSIMFIFKRKVLAQLN